MNPKGVIAFPCFNQKEAVLKRLEKVAAWSGDFTPVLIDNASTDRIFEAVRRQFPQVQWVRHLENLGHAEAVNAAFRFAIQEEADFLLMVERDDLPSEFPGELLQKVQENPRAGVGGESPLFLFFRMDAVRKTGFLDPLYFSGYEYEDWRVRLESAGYEWQAVENKDCSLSPYYEIRNRLFFRFQNSSLVSFAAFFLSFLGQFIFKDFPEQNRQGKQKEAREALRGLIDFLKRKRGGREFVPGQKSFLQRTREQFAESSTGLKRVVRYYRKSAAQRPLLIRAAVDWNIGDEIVTIPCYEAIKKKFPGCQLEVRVKNPALLKGSPWVDFINREGSDPDLILNLRQWNPRRVREDFLRELLQVPSLSAPKVYVSEEEKREVWKKWNLQEDKLRAAVLPSAQWFFAREWPRRHWIQLIEHLERRREAQVFVLGKDAPPMPAGIDLINQTTLRETAALLSQCDLFIGSDSGVLHLALAVGTPSVGLFGPLDPALIFPKRDNFIPLYSEVECRGCWSEGRMKFRDHCPKIVPDCLSSISTERVIRAAESLRTPNKIVS